VLGSRPPKLDRLPVLSHDDAFNCCREARTNGRPRWTTAKGCSWPAISYGATPCNLASKLIARNRVEVVAGVSLPMLVRAFTYRDKGLPMMVSKAVSGGRDGVLHVELSLVHATTRA
jgi:PTS system ascorbate-specific IIA component